MDGQILAQLRRMGPKVGSIDKLVKHIFAQCCDKGVPQVDFIVDNFDRTSGMGEYWNNSPAFRPIGNGALITGGATITTDVDYNDGTYGSVSPYSLIIEPLSGFGEKYLGYGWGAGAASAGVAEYQAEMRGAFTAELGFTIDTYYTHSAGVRKTCSVTLFMVASSKVYGGLYSVLGSRVGYATLDYEGNAGLFTEKPFRMSWGNNPTDSRAAGNETEQITGSGGKVAIATGMASSIVGPAMGCGTPQLNYFKAWVNGVTPPSQTGHGTVDEEGNYQWADKYHSQDEDGNWVYDPDA